MRIGKRDLHRERASANYFLRQVEVRRSKKVSWEIVDAESGLTVLSGIADRDEALRAIKAWETLSRKRRKPLDNHRFVH